MSELIVPVSPVKGDAGIGEIGNPGNTVHISLTIADAVTVGHVTRGAFINNLIIAGRGGVILVLSDQPGGHG